MNHSLRLFLFVRLLLHRLAAASAVSADPPAGHQYGACSDKLVAFSTCLPYVALAPNNLTDAPPPKCCDEVSVAFGDGSDVCLCYFARRPGIFGFPLNYSKLMSLTSDCPMKDGRTSNADFSLETLCSRPAALPPLRSISGPRNPLLPSFGAVNNLPVPPLMGSTGEPKASSSSTEAPSAILSIEEPADASPPEQSPLMISSTAQRMYIASWTWLCFYTLTCKIEM